jgi:hypothetical protein
VDKRSRNDKRNNEKTERYERAQKLPVPIQKRFLRIQNVRFGMRRVILAYFDGGCSEALEDERADISPLLRSGRAPWCALLVRFGEAGTRAEARLGDEFFWGLDK